MTDVGIVLMTATAAGLIAAAFRLPPLIGFLVAGFGLNTAGIEAFEGLDLMADLGIALLLFGIGLKLDVRVLARREVWSTAVAHLTLSTIIAGGFLALLALVGIGFLTDVDWAALATVGFALAFSSTVLVVKVLDRDSAVQSRLGQIAIGVLLIQDIAAVVFLTLAKGSPPSLWALALLLLVPAGWPLRLILSKVDHGELLPLLGVALALGPGYLLFESVGLKGDLGALLIGLMLASAPRAGELSKALFSVKELLLVAFFLSIGFTGLPSGADLLLAGLLLLLIPVKSWAFFVLLRWQGVRQRTAVRAGVVLGNYSEFGLIVIAVGAGAGLVEERWLVVVATAVAAGSLLSILLNKQTERLLGISNHLFPPAPVHRLLPEDRPIDVAHANAVVFGMGRVGQAAYRHLEGEYGLRVVGVENRPDRAALLNAEGMEIVEADATDPELWHRLEQAQHLDLALLAMPFHGANVAALHLLEASAFEGTVAAVAQYDDEADDLRAHVDTVLGLYDGAGTTLADDAAEQAGLSQRDS